MSGARLRPAAQRCTGGRDLTPPARKRNPEGGGAAASRRRRGLFRIGGPPGRSPALHHEGFPWNSLKEACAIYCRWIALPILAARAGPAHLATPRTPPTPGSPSQKLCLYPSGCGANAAHAARARHVWRTPAGRESSTRSSPITRITASVGRNSPRPCRKPAAEGEGDGARPNGLRPERSLRSRRLARLALP
jgi:hypothetical protein